MFAPWTITYYNASISSCATNQVLLSECVCKIRPCEFSQGWFIYESEISSSAQGHRFRHFK